MEKYTSPFLSPEWQNLQQQYIDALSALNPDSTGPGSTSSGLQGWQEALEHWRKSVESFLPPEAKLAFDNILQQTQLYYSMADDFAGMLRDISMTDRNTGDWREVMSRHLGKMKAQYDACETGHQAWSTLSPLFRPALLDGWRNLARAMSISPEDIFENPVHDEIEKLQQRLSAIPGIGPTREFQEKLASALALWKQYELHYRNYHSTLSQLGKLALDRLESRIIRLAGEGGRITSLRQIYNYWIDANEEVFSGFVFNDDYARLYADLVNALMRYRQKCNEIIDDILVTMNMPTGAGMQTVYKRQQQMRQALRESLGRQQQMEDSLSQILQEVERLRSRLKPVGSDAKDAEAGVVRKKKTTRRPS
jgi:class III poly(R)-hydroxyalkanoic acid synthase PhaE subunit